MKMTGRHVIHRRFGDGVIKSCENDVIQILFQDYGARRFHYPEAFDRFLTTEDADLAAQAKEDLNIWKLGQEAEDARVIQLCIERVREARTKKTTKSKSTKATTAKKTTKTSKTAAKK